MEERIRRECFPMECWNAYDCAKVKHGDIKQVRKCSGLPYFVHPKGVAKIVMDNGGTIDQICAALLHDVIEDCPTTDMELKIRFGEHVANLVRELTNQRYKIEQMGKEAYMSDKLMKLSNEALLIKLADILYNITDSPTEAQEVRMLKNVAHLIQNRKDLTDNTLKLAIQVFGE